MRRTPPIAFLNVGVIAAAMVIVANVVAFGTWTAPRLRARWSAAGAAGQAQGARERIEPLLQQARGSYGRVVTAEADLRDLRGRMTGVTTGSDLMGMLVRAGDAAGLDLEAAWDASFQLGAIDELGVVQLGIALPVTGSYEAVRRLLDQLAALPVFVVVDGISLQRADALRAGGPPGAGGRGVRLDLALSFFLPDPQGAPAPEDVAAGGAARIAGGASSAAARAAEELRTAQRGDDPEALADAIVDRLASLPPLPIDPSALVVHLERLERVPTVVGPERNLFAVVDTYVPPPIVEAPEPVDLPEPEPVLPVQLRGVMRIDGLLHASLSDGVDVYIVTAGDNLPNGVEIIEVGVDYVEVQFRGERTRLSLEGNPS